MKKKTMANRNQLQKSSRLRQLGPTQLTRICQMIDPDITMWKDFTARIKNRNRMPMFTNDQIWNIKEKCDRSGQSPTKSVISSWCTDNPTIEDLKDILIDIKCYRAADYINMDVLNCPGPVPRRPQEAIPVNAKSSDRDHFTTEAPLQISISGDQYSHYSGDLQSADLKLQLRTPIDTGPSPWNKKGTSSTTCLKEPLSGDTAYQSVNEEITSPIRTEPVMSIRDIQGLEIFPISEIQKSTNNFDERPLSEGGRLLGEGGFGKVFQGRLPGLPDMAVKCLSPEVFRESGPLAIRQFRTELQVLEKCQHKNMVNLLGFCDRGVCCLVYEYMPNGSLEERLACLNGTKPLPIKQRLAIVEGVALGLNYLHSNFEPAFVHRDIKSANVLLDKDFEAKIGDFGTARLGPKDLSKTHTFTHVFVGTQAYMAPEYLENGEISVKLDAYSYGVVLLEIITGLAPADENRADRLLPTHIRETLETDDDILENVDPKVGPWTNDTVMMVYKTATRLLSSKRKRPTIQEILPDVQKWTAQYQNESKC